MCEVRIGTSGWHYDHWVGPFHPDKLPKDQWFEHYSRCFNTVEVNSTFYHLPKETTVRKWRLQAPKGFLYGIKASRYITHIKRLKDCDEEIGRFYEVVDLFEDTLGPVLFQLPPSLHQDIGLLKAFIQALPRRHPAVFEFRHPSWYDRETFDLLDRLNAGFCVHDLEGKESPRMVTGKMIYLRFHGTSGRYSGSYPDSMLSEWAVWIKDQGRHIKETYAYFNNDIGGHAIQDAQTLKRLVEGK